MSQLTETEVIVNEFITYLSQLSDQDLFLLLSKEFSKYIKEEPKIAVKDLESFLANLIRDFIMNHKYLISSRGGGEEGEGGREEELLKIQMIMKDVNIIISSLMQRITSHPQYSIYHNQQNLIITDQPLFDWIFVCNICNYASNAPLREANQIIPWHSIIAQNDAQGEEKKHSESIELNAGNRIEKINEEHKKGHQKARGSYEVNITDPDAIFYTEIVNTPTKSTNSDNNNNNNNNNNDSPTSNIVSASNRKKREARGTMIIDNASPVTQSSDRYAELSPTHTQNAQEERQNMINSSNKYQDLINGWRETTIRLKDIVLQLSDFEDGVMRETTQINDKVEDTSMLSTESLKVVKKIYEKQEQYHQEGITRLRNEMSNKIEQNLFNNNTEIGPRSQRLRGSVASALEENTPQRPSRFRGKHNRSATLTALTDQMYEYKDYTAMVDIAAVKNNINNSITPISDKINLAAIRKDKNAQDSESDDSISSQEHIEPHNQGGKVKQKNRKSMKGKQPTKNINTITITPVPITPEQSTSKISTSVTFSPALPTNTFTTPEGYDVSPSAQLIDLQQSMSELLRHLKQPSLANFTYASLENSLEAPTGQQKEKKKEREKNRIDSENIRNKSPIEEVGAKEKIGELQSDLEKLKKKINEMKNTQKVFETKLIEKDTIIMEQKAILQKQKDFKTDVQGWKNDLFKEVTTMLRSNPSIAHRLWREEDSLKIVATLGVGQNEVLARLKQVLDFQNRVQERNRKREQESNRYDGNVLNHESGLNPMQQLTQLTTTLTQDMGSAGMLSALRDEYKVIREERDTLKRQLEQFRQHNSELLTRVNNLEEETRHLRESKQATIKNMVDEMNGMRQKIVLLSQIINPRGSLSK